MLLGKSCDPAIRLNFAVYRPEDGHYWVWDKVGPSVGGTSAKSRRNDCPRANRGPGKRDPGIINGWCQVRRRRGC